MIKPFVKNRVKTSVTGSCTKNPFAYATEKWGGVLVKEHGELIMGN